MYLQTNGKYSCIAAVSSVTLAIKAQRALNSSGIPSEVISLTADQTRRGCAYGLEFSCTEESAVRALLRTAHIPVSQYLKKGDTSP